MSGKSMRMWAVLLVVMLAVGGCAHRETWKRWHNALKPANGKWYRTAVVLTKKEYTPYQIVIPAAASDTEKQAADELVHWLKSLSNVQFPIVTDDNPSQKKEISVGWTNRLTELKTQVTEAELGRDGYAIGRKGKKLFILGSRDHGITIGVYAFLEEELQCRWYMPYLNTPSDWSRVVFRPVPRMCIPPVKLEDVTGENELITKWAVRNHTNILPANPPSMEALAKTMRVFAAYNTIQEDYGSGVLYNYDPLQTWVKTKLEWDPSRDMWQLVLDYVWGNYENSSKHIAEYYMLLRQAATQYPTQLKSGQRAADAPFLTAEFLGKAAKCFADAENRANNDLVLRSVLRAELPLMYVRICKGPDFVGGEYKDLVDKFERTVRENKIPCIEQEGDLDAKLAQWRSGADPLMRR